MALDQAKRQSDQASGVSNVAYDLVSILHNKLQAISAMEIYKKDAQQAGDREVATLLEEFERRDSEDVNRLKQLVASRLR